jgi:hypothetical protein
MSWLKSFIHWGFLFVQLITAILAIRCWNRSRSIAWRFFIIIWVLTFITETAGKIMGYYDIHNLWLYNYFDTVFYPAIVLLYFLVFTNSWLRWFALIASIALFIWSVVYLITDKNTALDTRYALAASTIILFFALVYLVQTSLDKESSTPLNDNFYYWFSTGFFIYFTFNAILIGMYTLIVSSKVSWLPTFTFYANHLVTLVLHVCLWAGFSSAFKWMK